LDQLERRYCKDTPFFRPFYIGAPKGPFLPGLMDSTVWTRLQPKLSFHFAKAKV
jgi:hypothetical protein